MLNRLAIFLPGLALLAACGKELPPRSVKEFLADPIMLEAAMVRCAENRDQTRYQAECVNAREAVKLIEAKEDQARRAELERQSERKREALRRTQQAAAEARRRAAEAEASRREAEYLAQFGKLPPAEGPEPAAGEPGAVNPEHPDPDADGRSVDDLSQGSAGSNAPGVEMEPAGDIDAIREELRRRSEDVAEP